MMLILSLKLHCHETDQATIVMLCQTALWDNPGCISVQQYTSAGVEAAAKRQGKRI